MKILKGDDSDEQNLPQEISHTYCFAIFLLNKKAFLLVGAQMSPSALEMVWSTKYLFANSELHRTAQFYLYTRTALHHKKLVNLSLRTTNSIPSQHIMINGIGIA